MNDFINYYELLGIEENATTEEIKLAYKTMIKKWHPDINKDSNASNMAVMLNEAKTVLLNEQKRQDYDNYLKTRKNQTYENLKKHTTKTQEQPNSYNKSYEYYSEEKTCTKWEYYRDYIKYYNAPVWYKIIVSVGIFLETILCGLLQILNIIIAYAFCIIHAILEYVINFIIGLTFLIAILGLFTGTFTHFKDWLFIILFIITLTIILALPDLIIDFLAEKMPSYLSKLNIYLFKKCVGYKN